MPIADHLGELGDSARLDSFIGAPFYREFIRATRDFARRRQVRPARYGGKT